MGFRLELLPGHRPLGRERTYRKGEALWLRDAPSHSVFLVERGEVEIVVPGHNGHETVVRKVKPGEICGLFAFCAARRLSAHTTGRAAMRTVALEIGCDEFTEFLGSTPKAALGVLATACERLAYAEERIHVMAHRNADERLAALLQQLATRTGRPAADDSGLVRIQCTHAELARLCGMNRAHVSVVLSRLRAKGLLNYGRGAPTEVNLPALLKYAGSAQAPRSPLRRASGA